MKSGVRLALVVIAASLGCAAGAGEKGDGGKKVVFETGYSSYFVKNNAPVKDNPAYLVFTDAKGFDQVFGIGATMKKPKVIDPEEFKTKIAVVAIRKGNAVWTYQVKQVTSAGTELRIEFEAKEGNPSTAEFASPLIVLVDGRDYTRVVFVENGKEVAKVDVKKQP
jgi:hypothetical protein